MPTARISLEVLRHNISVIQGHLRPETAILAAVKADAYGHGAVPTAKHLESCGVSWFGVATPEEALELRAAGIYSNILIFTPVYHRVAELIENKVTLTVADQHSLSIVKKTGLKATIHLKVDTGMGRLGLGWQEAARLAQKIDADANVGLGAVWTHFACSDDENRGVTECQLEAFRLCLDELERAGVKPSLVHSANSAATLAYPESHFDMVRPGIAVYGYHSSSYIAATEPRLQPALSLSAPVTFVKRVKKGTPISYSYMWSAPRDTTIATVRIGYADGYPRLLSGKTEVLVKGQCFPVAGRVCMDQLMVDVGDLDVAEGDTVTLIGTGLDAEMLAARIGTISYELLVGLGGRIERVYE